MEAGVCRQHYSNPLICFVYLCIFYYIICYIICYYLCLFCFIICVYFALLFVFILFYYLCLFYLCLFCFTICVYVICVYSVTRFHMYGSTIGSLGVYIGDLVVNGVPNESRLTNLRTVSPTGIHIHTSLKSF